VAALEEGASDETGGLALKVTHTHTPTHTPTHVVVLPEAVSLMVSERLAIGRTRWLELWHR
jgi:hypothetical protein